MKKLKLLLSLALALCLLALAGAGVLADAEIADVVCDGGVLTCTLTASESGTVVLAAYDYDGALIGVSSGEIEGGEITLGIDAGEDIDKALVKAFLWTSKTELIPLGEAAELDWTKPVEIVFEGDGVSYDTELESVSAEGADVTISAAGTYILSGSSDNGSVTVAKNSGEVTLYLNNLTLTSTSTAPLELKGGSNEITIVATDGTVNTLSDVDRDEAKPKSAINASKDITLCGGGTLNVNGNNKNGIKSDTNVTIDELTLNVSSKDNAIAADNVLTINGGTITVVSQEGDGLRASPDEITDDTTGCVVINGGKFNITALGDGIQADGDLSLYGGEFDITCGGGSSATLSDEDASAKALKAANILTVSDGTFNIDAADDAVHSNAYVYVYGGNFTIKTGDDGFHADTSLYIGEENGETAPVITIAESYEGLEGGTVYVYDGEISVRASDDGVNSAGGSDGTTENGNDSFNPGGGGPGGNRPGGNGGGWMPGGMMFESGASGDDYAIYIYGGTLDINADGDGIDSNGNIYMYGGDVTVFGAANDGNGALDFEGSFAKSGGNLLAVGCSGMAQSPSSGSIAFTLSQNSISAGSTVKICLSDEELTSFEGVKRANHVVYSPESLSSGTYTLYVNGNRAATATAR